MIIRSLRLENVKSYTSASFTFTEGVNAIVGRNGAGKSTILEAIGYALFDYGSGKSLTRQGANSGQITVGIESALDGRCYDIVRRTVGAWYVHDVELGARLHTSSADVTGFLREHMGLSRTVDLTKVFEDAVGVPQGTVTAVFLRTHSQRKTVFDPLLEVEEYDSAFQNLLDARNLYRERHADLRAALARIEGILEKLPDVELQHSHMRTEVMRGESTLADATAHLVVASAESRQWEERRRTVESARQSLMGATTAYDRAHALHEAAAGALAEAQRAQSIVVEHQSGHDAYLATREERTALEAQVKKRQNLLLDESTLAAALAKTQEEIARADDDLIEIARNETLVRELATAAAREETVRNELDALRGEQRQLTLHRETLVRLEATLVQENTRLGALKRDAAHLAQLQTEASAAATRDAELSTRIETLAADLSARKALGESVKEQTTALAATPDASDARCPVCEQSLTPDHRHALEERNKERLARLRQEWVALSQQRTSLETERTTAQDEGKRIAEAIAALPTQTTIDQAQRYVDDLTRQQQEALQMVASREVSGKRIPALEAELAALGEPRVARAVALQVVARRPQVEERRATAVANLTTLTLRQETLARELALFADLDARLAAVQQSEHASAPAWQQVIAHQQVAAQLPLRQEAANASAAVLATAAERRDAAVQACSVAESAWDEVRADAARLAEGEARAEVGAIASRLDLHRAELARLEREHQFLLEQQREHTTLIHQRDRLAHEEEVFTAMRNIIKAAGPQITRALIGQVGAYAAQWFGELTGDFARRLKFDEEYAISLEENGRDLDFKSLSGGEQMAAALSVRLALLRELGKIDVAFFDEPTAHLDVERREALAKQIMQVKGFRQIFVISHDDTFEHQTDNVIHVERAHDGSKVRT